MNDPYDVIIVGSGPAGVSAALPIAETGLNLLLIDGDIGVTSSPPVGNYLDLRFQDRHQAHWMTGENPVELCKIATTSPRVRLPRNAYVIKDFTEENRIVAEDFAVFGSLVSGGLSNLWGCSVARFDDCDLGASPVKSCDLIEDYAAVCQRIGVSGKQDDALRSFFGVDDWALPPLPLAPSAAALWARCQSRELALSNLGARFGRARLAILQEDRAERRACDSSGLCFWGCHRGAPYSARYDLQNLKRMRNVQHRPGVVVDAIAKTDRGWLVSGTSRDGSGAFAATARRVVLGAGTLATTRLVLKALELRGKSLRLLSSPVLAFLALMPREIGRPATRTVGFDQLAFAIDGVTSYGSAFGSLFSAVNIPVREFIRYIPTSRATAITLWRTLCPATLLGNCFLPGALSANSVTLDAEDRLIVKGGQMPDAAVVLDRLRTLLPRVFLKLGAVVLPGSMMMGLNGSDIHYASTLPMRQNPIRGEANAEGAIEGLPGLFVVDGSVLPDLPAKPHTLTIMANARRIGRCVARQFDPGPTL